MRRRCAGLNGLRSVFHSVCQGLGCSRVAADAAARLRGRALFAFDPLLPLFAQGAPAAIGRRHLFQFLVSRAWPCLLSPEPLRMQQWARKRMQAVQSNWGGWRIGFDGHGALAVAGVAVLVGGAALLLSCSTAFSGVREATAAGTIAGRVGGVAGFDFGGVGSSGGMGGCCLAMKALQTGSGWLLLAAGVSARNSASAVAWGASASFKGGAALRGGGQGRRCCRTGTVAGNAGAATSLGLAVAVSVAGAGASSDVPVNVSLDVSAGVSSAASAGKKEVTTAADQAVAFLVLSCPAAKPGAVRHLLHSCRGVVR